MKILFICLGNICRSPTAEGVFKSFVDRDGLGQVIEIDSAGTSGCHVGERADERMRKHASARGYDLTSLSRKFDPFKDFEKFDRIIVMDQSNLSDILDLDRDLKFKEKVCLMTDYCKNHSEKKVPDPYYGGAKGFETVLDIVEDACQGLLEDLKKEL